MINKTMKLPDNCVGVGMTCPSETSDLFLICFLHFYAIEIQ